MADNLKMTMSLVDDVTKKLKAIQANLVSAGKDVDGKLTPSMKKNREEFERHNKHTGFFQREMHAVRDVVGKVSPEVHKLSREVGEFSLGAGAATAVIAGLGFAAYETIKGLSEFSNKFKELRYGARETGLMASDLKQLQLAGDRFGITEETMGNGLKSFTWAISGLRDGFGGFRQSMAQSQIPLEWFEKTIERLKKEGTGGAFQGLLDLFDQIRKRYPQVQAENIIATITKNLNLPDQFKRLGGQEFGEVFKEVRQNVPTDLISEVAEKAKHFNEALEKANLLWERMSLTIKNNILGPATTVLETLDKISKIEFHFPSFPSFTVPETERQKRRKKVGASGRVGTTPTPAPTETEPTEPTETWQEREQRLQKRRKEIVEQPEQQTAPPTIINKPIPKTAPPKAPWRKGMPLPVPQYKEGTDFVTRDMLAKIHRGEMIVPEEEANKLRELGRNAGGGSGNSSKVFEMLKSQLGNISPGLIGAKAAEWGLWGAGMTKMGSKIPGMRIMVPGMNLFGALTGAEMLLPQHRNVTTGDLVRGALRGGSMFNRGGGDVGHAGGRQYIDESWKSMLSGGAGGAGGGASADRDNINGMLSNEVYSRVEGTGKLTVDVNAPRGTNVNASGGGLFKTIELNRSMQMTPASYGPTERMTN